MTKSPAKTQREATHLGEQPTPPNPDLTRQGVDRHLRVLLDQYGAGIGLEGPAGSAQARQALLATLDNIVTSKVDPVTGGITTFTAGGATVAAVPVIVQWSGIDDTSAIDDAITQAGALGAIAFIFGKEYKTRGGHELLSGQMVFGNGATVKKLPQVTSVLKTGTTYSAAAKTVDVETPGIFVPGMWVQVTSPLSALVEESTYYTTSTAYRQVFAAKVVSVNGNTVTVDRMMDIYGGSMVLSAANGALLAENGPMFFAGKNWSDYPAVPFTWDTAPSHIKIFDLTFNGDRLNNTQGAWWATAAILEMDSHYLTVERCRFQDIASDSILCSGKSIRILNTHFATTDGNCTHPGAYQSMSATKGTEDFLAQGCSARDVLKTYKRGHAFGAFSASNNCTDTKYIDCHVDVANACAFGAFVSNTDACTVISGCTANNVNGAAFKFSSGFNISITGSVFKNCINTVNATLPSGAAPISQIINCTGVTITGNVFENSPLLVNETPGRCVISGNSFMAPTLVQPASAAYFALLGVSSSGTGSHHVISGNSFVLKAGDSNALDGDGAYTSGAYSSVGNVYYGGRYGTRVRSSNTDVTISNTYVDPYTMAIDLNNNGATAGRVRAQGNSIKLSAAATAAPTWVGIGIDNYNATEIGPVSVLNNTIDCLRANNTAYGISFYNVTNAAQKCTVIGNNIAVTNAGDETIRAAVNIGATSLVAGNRLSKAVHASISTAGIVTGLTGNLVM